MLKKCVAITGIVVALTAPSFADGFYLQGQGGVNFLSHNEIRGLDDNDDVALLDLDYKTGHYFGGAVGYRFNKNWRGEIEVGHRRNTLKSATVKGVSEANDDAKRSTTSAMFNGYYDFANSTNFTPYLGAGLGFARTQLTVEGKNAGKGNAFAYQGIAGTSYKLSENLDTFLEYRYFGTKVKDDSSNDVRLNNHTIDVGLRYNF